MKKIFILISIALIILAPAAASALKPEDFPSQNIRFYNRSSTACSPAVASADLSKNIPPEWGKIFAEAAAKFDVNPNFLAALYLSENGNVWKPVVGTSWPTSSAAASGPMQFIPGTWAGHQQDGDGDGVKDINNVYDAVYAAAHLVKALGTDKNTPLGNIDQPWKRSPRTLIYAAAAYNWGEGNIQGSTSDTSPIDAGPTETIRYIKNIYTLFNSDFTKSGHENYRDPKPQIGATNLHTLASQELEFENKILLAEDSTEPTTQNSSGCNPAAAHGSINKIVELATQYSKDRNAYVEARKQNPGAGGDYTDCGKFVSTVMRLSGADPDYPPAGTSNQLPYLQKSSKYTVFQTKSIDDLQPGDILINNGGVGGGHTFLYLGDIGDGKFAASASLGDHDPELKDSGYVQWQLDKSTNYVARLKA